MRLSQGRLDGTRVVRPGEYEPKIPMAFRQRHNLMTNRYADRDVLNTDHRPRGLKTLDVTERAEARNRNHHDPSSVPFALHRPNRHAQCMAQDQLLKCYARTEP